MSAAKLPLRVDLEGMEPYGAPQLNVPVRLNVNENPYAPSQAVIDDIVKYVADAAAGLNRYPDRDFFPLRSALAEYLEVESHVHVDPRNIWAANGSNEVMLQILQAFGGLDRTVACFTPTYSMYNEYARDTNTRFFCGYRTESFELELDEVARVVNDEHPSVILIPSPNNPSGTALPLDQAREIITLSEGKGPLVHGEKTSPIVVIDEAYAEFRRDGIGSALELLNDFENLIVSRTMSKAFGMAGLRLGYMAAHQKIIDAITLIRLPYHLSALTQAAALAALAHRKELMNQISTLRTERDALAQWLSDQRLTVAQSDANFILFGIFKDREAIFRTLLDKGILIRVVGPEGYLRVSVGTPEENQLFKTALKEAINE